MSKTLTTTATGVAVVLLLSSCSLMPGGSGGADGPVLTGTKVADILVTAEDVNERLGGGWSLDSEPADTDGTSLMGNATTVTDEVLEIFGEDCGGALFGDDAPDFGGVKEASMEDFHDGDGRLAVVSIYRFSDTAGAKGYVSYLQAAMDICRDASQRNPQLGFSAEDTSFDEGALWFQDRDGAEDEERMVFVAKGDLVVSGSSRVSVAQADQLVQTQLDKVAALVKG